MREASSSLDLQKLDRKLNYVAWASFLLMWGVTFLVQQIAQVDLRNGQYVAAGLILLALNGARYARGIPMSRLTVVLGLLAFAGGVVRQLNGELSLVPIVLITAGSLLLAQGLLALEGRYQNG